MKGKKKDDGTSGAQAAVDQRDIKAKEHQGFVMRNRVVKR